VGEWSQKKVIRHILSLLQFLDMWRFDLNLAKELRGVRGRRLGPVVAAGLRLV
jgi:hypothetical protein